MLIPPQKLPRILVSSRTYIEHSPARRPEIFRETDREREIFGRQTESERAIASASQRANGLEVEEEEIHSALSRAPLKTVSGEWKKGRVSETRGKRSRADRNILVLRKRELRRKFSDRSVEKRLSVGRELLCVVVVVSACPYLARGGPPILLSL